jgi:hypothetical protein
MRSSLDYWQADNIRAYQDSVCRHGSPTLSRQWSGFDRLRLGLALFDILFRLFLILLVVSLTVIAFAHTDLVLFVMHKCCDGDEG